MKGEGQFRKIVKPTDHFLDCLSWSSGCSSYDRLLSVHLLGLYATSVCATKPTWPAYRTIPVLPARNGSSNQGEVHPAKLSAGLPLWERHCCPFFSQIYATKIDPLEISLWGDKWKSFHFSPEGYPITSSTGGCSNTYLTWLYRCRWQGVGLERKVFSWHLLWYWKVLPIVASHCRQGVMCWKFHIFPNF